mgnify:CR=1 FL=1
MFSLSLKELLFIHPNPIHLNRDTLLGGIILADSEVFYLLGADEGVKAILHDFYDRMFADEDLAPYFEGVDQEQLRDRHIRYFINHMLGRNAQEYREPILRKSHKGLGLTFEHYERAIMHMNAAMRKNKVSLDARVYVETYFRASKPHIIEK